MVGNGGDPECLSASVDVLSVAESHALFESRSRAWLGLSRIEFLDALRAGRFDAERDSAPVRDLLALLPFALAGDPA